MCDFYQFLLNQGQAGGHFEVDMKGPEALAEWSPRQATVTFSQSKRASSRLINYCVQ